MAGRDSGLGLYKILNVIETVCRSEKETKELSKTAGHLYEIVWSKGPNQR